MDFAMIAILTGAIGLGTVKFYVESMTEEQAVKNKTKVETETK